MQWMHTFGAYVGRGEWMHTFGVYVGKGEWIQNTVGALVGEKVDTKHLWGLGGERGVDTKHFWSLRVHSLPAKTAPDVTHKSEDFNRTDVAHKSQESNRTTSTGHLKQRDSQEACCI